MFKTIISYIKFYYYKIFTAKYEIEGKCKQCGECCKNIVFMIENDYVKTEKQFESLKEFDKKYKNFEINSITKDNVLLFRCKSLNSDNKCKDYMLRSLYCRAYPFVTDKIRLGGCETFENCGYKIKINKKFKDFLAKTLKKN